MRRFPSDFIWWILTGVLVVESAVRFVIPFRLDRVLMAESIVFILSAALLGSIARRRPDLSSRIQAVARVLSIAFVLGAIRSALWLTGVDVQIANLTILLIGFLLFGIWRYTQKKRRATTE